MDIRLYSLSVHLQSILNPFLIVWLLSRPVGACPLPVSWGLPLARLLTCIFGAPFISAHHYLLASHPLLLTTAAAAETCQFYHLTALTSLTLSCILAVHANHSLDPLDSATPPHVSLLFDGWQALTYFHLYASA